MKIKIQRVNSGIRIFAVNKNGSQLNRIGNKTLEALKRACNWYHSEVESAFHKLGIGNSGYASEWRRSYFQFDDRSNSFFLETSIWGMAFEDENGFSMNNSGSTPTAGRAKVLAAYQAPLEKNKYKDDSFGFSIVKDF